MSEVNNNNFGPLVAYLVPGATVLLGLRPFSPLLRAWFAATPADAPTIGGFLYLTVASIAVGMIVNAIRWAVIDTLHAWTGLSLPRLDFSRLGKNVEAYQLLIQIHYNHFQFHANMFMATAIAYSAHRFQVGLGGHWGWLDVGVILLEAVFYVTSRDTLRKYFSRSRQLLSAARND